MKIRTKDDAEFHRKSETYSKNKFVCKNCGHKQLVPIFMGKNLCDCCGRWVFRNSKDEFKFRMKENLNK